MYECRHGESSPSEVTEDNLVWVLDLRDQNIYELDSELEVSG